jgi:beta-glucanase (GH16 family)
MRYLLAITIVAGCSAPAPRPAPPQHDEAAAKPTPVWQDEFDGPAGASFDRTKWVPVVNGEGGGNQERQFYTDGENTKLDGDGHLVITARREPESTRECWYGKCVYTSGRINTKGLFAQLYGRFEARIRVPRGQGVWPAFWMLGVDDAKGWPECGEIDIMENIGKEPALVHGTVHGPGYSGAGGVGHPTALPSGAAYADDFHVYAVEWRPEEIMWFVDGKQYFRVTPAELPAGKKWVFDHPHYLLLNFAVGGGWPGDPDDSTTFPQQMTVDYVRVYKL